MRARDEFRAVVEGFVAADKRHEDSVLAAMRAGSTPPTDERATAAERQAALSPHLTRVAAAFVALAEFAQHVVDTFRAREVDWLAALRERLPTAEEKKREAQRLLDEARADEFRVHSLGRWVQANADDFSQQAPPDPATPAPQMWQRSRDALERPWHKHQPWNAPAERAYEESGHAPTPLDDGRIEEMRRAAEAPVEYVEEEAAAGDALVEPLDDSVRWGERVA